MRCPVLPLLCALLAAPLLASAQPASAPAPASAAAERVLPVIQLGVDVPPYYIAGKRYGAPATVTLDPAYDALLSSVKAADIRRARDAIAARPELAKPELLIALAMRLWDVGLRDDAAFWYYAGRDRFLTMTAVLDLRSLQLAPAARTAEAFVRAAGPAMDGYAYCSVAHQEDLEDDAIAWVAAHPYQLLGYTELPARGEDRNAALVAAVRQLREDSAAKKAQLEDPAALAALEDARRQGHAHERFCW